MRMRKKKWAEPYLDAHPEYALTDPRELKGQWKAFLKGKTLHVEIGTGKGDYLMEMSRMYPEDAWVGIEKEHNVAAIACRKMLEDETFSKENNRLIVADGANLEDWFEEGEIDMIHLNFSDPWPKKYTHKRRLSSESFLRIYEKLLSPEGCVRMKTDNQNLFEDSVLYFLQNGFTFTEFSVNFRRNEHPEDAITEYEKRFMELGQPIFLLKAVIDRSKGTEH